ncbi:MAG: glucosidase, partial [Paraburkholderia nemoris]
GAYPQLQADPRSRDLILFHEYFHGDNGRGVGASHQTGWTGLVALLLQPRVMSASGNVPLAGETDQAPIPTSPSAQATAPACPAEAAPAAEPAHASAK